MVFGTKAAGYDGRVGVYKGLRLLDGLAIEDEDAAQVGVVAHRAGDEELSHFGEATNVFHVAGLDFCVLFFLDFVRFLVSVQHHHDIAAHRVGGVAVFHFKFTRLRRFGGLGGGAADATEDQEECNECFHGGNLGIFANLLLGFTIEDEAISKRGRFGYEVRTPSIGYHECFGPMGKFT